MKKTPKSKVEVVEVLNASLNWRIERSSEGFKLYDEFGYSGTFPTHSAAKRRFNIPRAHFPRAVSSTGW